jgi:hypothetical protein
MKKQISLGLDELMIVNPGGPGEAEPGMAIFLGEDGTLYQVQGLEDEENAPGLAGFYLGDDGRLYQLQGLDALIPPQDEAVGMADSGRMPRFFLGEDGTLYEIRNR